MLDYQSWELWGLVIQSLTLCIILIAVNHSHVGQNERNKNNLQKFVHYLKKKQKNPPKKQLLIITFILHFPPKLPKNEKRQRWNAVFRCLPSFIHTFHNILRKDWWGAKNNPQMWCHQKGKSDLSCWKILYIMLTHLFKVTFNDTQPTYQLKGLPCAVYISHTEARLISPSWLRRFV